MASVRKHSVEQLEKDISIWTWMGRILPLIYVPISIVTYYYYQDTISILTAVTLIISPLVAIIWWWWAMDTMKWLSILYDTTIDKQLEIIKELREIKDSLNDNRHSDRKW